MKSESIEAGHSTVLVVADDSDMLGILNHILTGRGYRVFLASEAAAAARLLDLELGIDSVMIRAGLSDSERIELMCLGRGVGVLFLCGIVEAGVIRLRVPEKRLGYAPRILIVDNDSAMRDLFDRHLSEDGYHVTTVQTSRQAWAAAQKTTFDVMVMDLNFLETGTLETIRDFRGDFPWMKILAVSGLTTGDIPGLILSAGATAVSSKAVTSWEFREAIYGLLDPARRWRGVTLSADGFRDVSVGGEPQKTWGWESGRTVASLAGRTMA